MGVQLDLAGTIKKNIVLSQLFQTLFKPFKIMFQLFKCVEDTTVGTQVVITHDLLEGHEVADVEGTWIARPVVCGIKIDNGALTSDCAHELVHWRAKSSV